MDSINNLKKGLILLGLSPKELDIYAKTFELGPANIEEIAKGARIKRSTAYLLVKQLIEKGFLFEDNKKYGKLIFALEPEKLLTVVSSRQRQFRRQEIELEEKMPELKAIYQADGVLPKVRVYEGKRGLLDVRKDILQKKQEILLWTNQETERKFFSEEYHKAFIEERFQNEMPIRVLAVKNELGLTLQKSDGEQLRKTKILSEGVMFNAETYIYGNKIAILDYQKDIIGIIIESVSVAGSQRAIFEMNWDNIKV